MLQVFIATSSSAGPSTLGRLVQRLRDASVPPLELVDLTACGITHPTLQSSSTTGTQPPTTFSGDMQPEALVALHLACTPLNDEGLERTVSELVSLHPSATLGRAVRVACDANCLL